MYSKNDIAKIKQIILKTVTPEEIILFGSYARGDFNKESDLDFLVVLKDELTRIEKNRIRNSLAFQFFDFNFNVDLIITSKSYVQRYKSISGTIIKPASESGKIIWKKLH